MCIMHKTITINTISIGEQDEYLYSSEKSERILNQKQTH